MSALLFGPVTVCRAAVVYKSVNGFLKHTLLVADYYLGCAELKELAQTVVSVDNAAVKIVEVARCEAAALELNHGTKLRRNNREHVENHPLGSVAALSERLDNLKALESLGLLLTACVLYLLAQLRGELIEVDFGKELLIASAPMPALKSSSYIRRYSS